MGSCKTGRAVRIYLVQGESHNPMQAHYALIWVQPAVLFWVDSLERSYSLGAGTNFKFDGLEAWARALR